MNGSTLPDLEFQVLGNLPNGFDWEAYTIDCHDPKKTMTLRTGIVEGANTVGRNYLLPGDGSCRTVGSAGRYVGNAAFGVVVPVRRDEKSTLMMNFKNPDFNKPDAVTANFEYLQGGFATFPSGGMGAFNDNTTSEDAGDVSIEAPAQLENDAEDVEEDPGETLEQMEGSTVPEGFDAGEGEAWAGKLITESTLKALEVEAQ
ncbi:hypothetical protein LTR36_005149 [Oleoguttula mirabilis]|uniref:Uncharacterized protein n=1 Tax=Oleoguttula mirabilis TaxID=1507867 RepID=A0AAV9JVX4_9PEZI|nr:hypothetical protein LTR36_005149 [Oleoguttula mirabilis]